MSNPLPMLTLTIICATLWLTSGAGGTGTDTGGDNSSGGGCIPSERAALLSFKKGITSDNTSRLGSWHGQDCCRWRGVTCSNLTGNVLMLHLAYPMNPDDDLYYTDVCDDYTTLFGEISRSLLFLRHLEHMDLSWNCLIGPKGRMPSFLGSMKNLRYLNLSGVPFKGSVPPQLGNLSRLQYLDLGSSYLGYGIYSKDITWLTNLPLLQYLGMGSVNLSGIAGHWPHILNMLPSLRVISLSFCWLGSANQSLAFFNLTKLEKLDLSFNNFHHTYISSWFWRATSLKHLVLKDTGLFGELPDALGNLTSLVVLDLSGNANITITQGLKNLCGLEILDLSANRINRDIAELMDRLPLCTRENLQLQELHLEYNSFTGTLTSSIGHFRSLSILELNNNNLRGSVPTEIGTLTNLTSLDLSNNNFGGVITEEHFVGLMNLKKIHLSFNNLSVVLDADWIQPFRLESAGFASCHLGPMFPVWLRQQLVYITTLDISSTGLVGNIPDWFWSFSRAGSLDMSYNQLNGNLPTDMSGMAFLELNLGSNNLTGQMPPFPRNIVLLDISNNSFSGIMPHKIEAPLLQTLVMSSNQIGGTIPKSICKLKNLSFLDLSNNLLEGEIPQCSDIERLEYCLLGNNSLSGTFPAFLRNCTSMVVLDLAWNNLSGRLPSWIWELKDLQFLRLSHNSFSGNIPSGITNLSFLQYLDLSGNYFFGVIPRHLSNLTGMTMKGYYPFDIFDKTVSKFDDIWLVMTKGQQLKYSREIAYFVSIDLSGNYLTGEIPLGITSLDALMNLNLSSNQLGGKIPNNIGAMRLLASLDLSINKLSGEIPWSLSNLTSLSYMNLSYNNLSGRIPSGRQLDTLNVDNPSLMYIGNSGLCGPLQNNCSGNGSFTPGYHRGNRQKFEPASFYFSLVLGLVVGLWTVFCALLFINTWRVAYLGLLDKVYDKIYVFVAVKWASMTMSAAAAEREHTTNTM
ncbi:LRR receptor-like serine/threonine-protein kinase GSO2 [Zea mays]|uniref:LRR protein WM1.10 n=3 Tax=Zea mays TaxID=4577 RepID=A0A1D6NQJ1_MAIZE|nr:LRR protein WM1.10 [Zea mays]PWZ32181.1 LRR receptor-like serine/threonine-protein kinase GSO2 [Zea mays]